MREELFGKPEKLSGNLEKMSDVTNGQLVDEMRGLIEQAVGQRGLGETVSRCLERASRYLGMPYKRVHSYWYRQVSIVRADELENARRKIMSTQARTKEIEAEIERLRGFNAKLDNSIHGGDTQLDCKKE